MTVTKIQEDRAGFVFQFDDSPVTQLCFDYAVTLISLKDFRVRIEVPFRYRHGNSEQIVDPEFLATAAPLLDLHQAQLQQTCVPSSRG